MSGNSHIFVKNLDEKEVLPAKSDAGKNDSPDSPWVKHAPNYTDRSIQKVDVSHLT